MREVVIRGRCQALGGREGVREVVIRGRCQALGGRV